jgi:hypothetical protein
MINTLSAQQKIPKNRGLGLQSLRWSLVAGKNREKRLIRRRRKIRRSDEKRGALPLCKGL